MNYQFFNELPQAAQMIREKVFMEEQGFQNEFDDIDQTCLHLVVYKNNLPIGCARMFVENEQIILGRIAVLKEYRHLHIGSYILKQLENQALSMGYHQVTLSAQCRASSFYEKNGYHQEGDKYYDEYCPHIHMIKTL